MPARPTDWSPLDCSQDPIAGDPDAVREAAQQYASTAESIKTAQTSLNNISYQSRGQAVTELQNKARELADQVGQAYSRCEGASEVLNGYAPHLESAQETSLEALREAEKTKHDLEQIQRQKSDVERAYYESKSPDQREALRQKYMRLGGQESSSQESLNAAKAKLRQAVEERDAAANEACEKLGEVSESSPIKDGLWDQFKGLLRGLAKVAESLKGVLDTLSNILTVITIVIAVVSPPVGTALLAAGFILSAATMACNTVINLSKTADGKMSIGEFMGRFAIDGALLAASGVGLKGSMAGSKAAKEAMKEGAEKGLSEGARRAGAAAKSAAEKTKINESAKGIREGLLTLNEATGAAKTAGSKLFPGAKEGMNRAQAMGADLAKELANYGSGKVFEKGKKGVEDIIFSSPPFTVSEENTESD